MKKGLLLCLLIGLLVGCTAPTTNEIVLEATRPVSQPTLSPSTTLPTLANSEWAGDGILIANWVNHSYQLQVIDPSTGQQMEQYPAIPLGKSYTEALSPDGKKLAVVTYKSDYVGRGELNLIDLTAWQMVTTTIKTEDWVHSLLFSPDGQRLTVTYPGRLDPTTGFLQNTQLMLVDIPTMSQIAQVSLDFNAWFTSFTADGSQLVLYGGPLMTDDVENPRPAQVAYLKVNDLSLTWQLALPEIVDGNYQGEMVDNMPAMTNMIPGLAFDPGRNKLYIVHADSEQLTTVDFPGRAVHTAAIQPPLPLFEQLLRLTAGEVEAKVYDGSAKRAVLSADGQRLYVVGVVNDTWQDENKEWNFTQTTLGLQLIEASSGTILASRDSEAQEIRLSANDNRLYLYAWSNANGQPWTEVADPNTLEQIAYWGNIYAIPGRTLDNRPVLLSSLPQHQQSQMVIVDLMNLDEINRFWWPNEAVQFMVQW